MKAGPFLLAAAFALGVSHPALATGRLTPQEIRGCIDAAAAAWHEPPAMLVILLNVEGGTLGAVSHNTNGTVDIGPMQINQIWLPQVAAHWHASIRTTYLALRDDFCPNVEAGAWILRKNLNRAHGHFWLGVGDYHSDDPSYRRLYLRAVLAQALRLEAEAAKAKPIAHGQRIADTVNPREAR